MNRKKCLSIVTLVTATVLVITSILSIPCSADGMGAIINDGAMRQYNSLIIDQYTFRKLSPHEGSNTSIYYELMKLNTNSGNVTSGNIEFSFGANEFQDFQFGNTNVSVIQELGYRLYIDERTHSNSRPVNVCRYDFYTGKQYENGAVKDTPYGLDLVTEHIIKSNLTVLHPSGIDEDPYNTSSYYVYFTSHPDIWSAYQLSDEFQNYIIFEYDVLQPQFQYADDGLTGVMNFKQIAHVNHWDIIEDFRTYLPFNEINTLEYEGKITDGAPLFITNLTIKIVTGGVVARPGGDLPIFRINIASPNNETSNAFNALTSVHTEFPVDEVDIEDVDWVRWITTQLTSLMQINFGGGLTIGIILFFSISVGLLLFFLKMFAGG